MTYNISDKDLLAELQSRFEAHLLTLKAQEKTVKELSIVNKKLLASEQLKSNFLSNIRNEINNPITSILELSQSIESGKTDMTTIRKFAGLIYSEVFNIDFQLHNIFLSAESEAGEIQLSKATTDIPSLMQRVVESFQHQSSKKEVVLLVKNLMDTAPLFYSDPSKLYSILRNLVSNAIKFSHHNGLVELSCHINNHRQLVLEVKDNGIGIREEDHSLIYDRFQQLDMGVGKAYQGQGLGLSVTKFLVEMLGGEIELKSQIGEGSTFTVKINEQDTADAANSAFSSEGNDFLFDGSYELIF